MDLRLILFIQYFIKLIFIYMRVIFNIMPEKELIEDELEKEMDKAFKEGEAKRDHCGTALPSSKEVGIQRTDVKLKEEKD